MKPLVVMFALATSYECFASSVTELISITPANEKENGFIVYVDEVNNLSKCANVKFPVRYKGEVVKVVTLQTKASLGDSDYFNIDLVNYDYSSEPNGEKSEVRWCSSNEKFSNYEMTISYGDYKLTIESFGLFQKSYNKSVK